LQLFFTLLSSWAKIIDIYFSVVRKLKQRNFILVMRFASSSQRHDQLLMF
jgi:hypothetical protein